MMQYPHWITITTTMAWKLVTTLIQTESICYRLRTSKRIPCGCVSKTVVAFVNINSVTLFVSVWFACACAFACAVCLQCKMYLCAWLSHCVWTGNTLPSHTNAHNPVNDMQQSLNTNPIRVTAARERTASAMWCPEDRTNESLVNRLTDSHVF